MRQWLWPYALLAIALTVIGLVAALTMLAGTGLEKVGAQLAAVQFVVVEPAKGFLVSMLDMVAPFAIPDWAKDLYAKLVLIALAGMALAAVAGLFLLPIFYALYRAAGRGES